MIRTFKWLYKLGYDRAMSNVYAEAEKAMTRHFEQAQHKAQEEYETKLKMFKVTPTQHSERGRGIQDLLTTLDPKRYPNIESYLEEML